MQPLAFTALTIPALIATVPGLPGDLLARKLDLDTAQKAAVRQVLQAHRPALRAKADGFRAARRALVDAGLDPKVDEAAFLALHARSAAAGGELALEARRVVRDLDPILTPDQRARARTLLAEARGHLDGLRTLALAP